MQAGEVGVRIRVDAIVDLVGTTTRELIVCGPLDATPRSLSMTIDTPTNFAVRTTIATDFPDPGNYFIQLKATFADGRILKSPVKLLHVGVMIL
jgi:hypothetical protein